LISINKVHSKSKNDEFNLRHDWNSLLSKNSKIRLKKFSPDYYPHANDFVKYLNYFKKYYKINVKYNTNVKKIYKNNNKFIIKTNNRTYICKYLIVATGLIYI
jgi:predicted flavoprotein YhiN